MGAQSKKRERGRKNIWRNTAQKSPSFMKDVMNLYIQEAQKIPRRKNSKRSTSTHVTIKLSKARLRVLKTAREKQFVMYNRSSIKLKQIPHQKL